MKFLTKIFLVTLAACASLGCTRNNGDIGPLFGQWHLTQIKIDDQTDTSYDGHLFWLFQNQVVEMLQMHPAPDNHVAVSYTGTWTRLDGYLVLNYSHSETDPDQAWRYKPAPASGLPALAEIPLKISRLRGGKMVLIYQEPDGSNRTFYFTKH